MNAKTEKIITDILERDKHARNSDPYLYVKYCEEIYTGDLSRLTIYDVMLSGEFPNYETIRRTRQAVAHERKDLAPDRMIAKWRKQKQEEFLNYARSVK